MQKHLKLFFLAMLFISFFVVSKQAYASTEFVSIIDPDNGAGTDYTSLLVWEGMVQADLSTSTTKVFSYGTASGTISDNNIVQGQLSGATATLLHQTASTTSAQILLKSISGTFQSGEQVYRQSTGASSTYIFLSNAGDSAIAVASCRSSGGTADVTAVTISGWTTASTTYIKIWTDPTTGARHNGKWDDGKYRLETTDYLPIDIFEDYLRIDGLQIKMLRDDGSSFGINIGDSNTGANTDIRLSNNIIKADNISTYGRIGINMSMQSSATAVAMAWNNIVYDMGNNVWSEGIDGGYGTLYVYNNTVINSRLGIYGGGTFYAKNNIVQNVIDGYSGGFDSSSDYNISSLGSDTTGGAHDKASTTVSFVDLTNKDFHLSSSDTAARNAGTSTPLWDANLNFTQDIDGSYRGAAWDIGADEVPTEFVSTICENASAGGGCANLDYQTLSVWEDKVETNLTASTTRVFSGYLTGVLGENTVCGVFVGGADTGIDVRIQATTSGQILIDDVIGTSTPLTVASGTEFRNGGTANMWTVTGTLDQLGASPIAVAKIDGAWANPDTTLVDIRDWTTGADNYIKVYTTSVARHSGKWDAGKYRLEASATRAIFVRVDHVRLEGLQLASLNLTGNVAGVVDVYQIGANNEFRLSNSILKGDQDASYMLRGLYLNDIDIKAYIFNNIVYGLYTGLIVSDRDDAFDISLSKNVYFYNNTVFGAGNGIDHNNGTVVLKNNIVQNCFNGFKGTFATSSDYNISDIAGDAPNLTFATTSKVITFADAANNDFHLADMDTAAKGAGVNLYADAPPAGGLNVTNDIDSAARPATSTIGLNWDIGADQTAVKIYRSIAPGLTAALTTGAANAMTISSSTSLATFATALADNIGVGDVIIYNTGGTATATAFIHGRSSSTVYTVKTASGTAPTAVTADTSWSIYRAYTTLSNAEAGIENSGITNDAIRNFDTWSGGADLVASNTQWNIAAYANSTTADTDAVTIDGWTTGAQNFIKIYTPVSASEAGTSQRHQGKWDDNKYNLIWTSGFFDGVISINENFVKVEGLQVFSNQDSFPGRGINIGGQNSGATIDISNNIIQGRTSGTNGQLGIYISDTDNIIIKIYNNIIFNFRDNGIQEATYVGGGAPGTTYVYNNTIYSALTNSIYTRNSDGRTTIAINNIVQGSSNGYYGAFSSSDNNISDVAGDAPNTTFATTSKVVQFVDAINKDFHLAPTDTAAIDAGVNLYTVNYSDDFSTDPVSRWSFLYNDFEWYSNSFMSGNQNINAAVYNSSFGGATQYAKVDLVYQEYGVKGGVVLRSTGVASDGYYVVTCNGTNLAAEYWDAGGWADDYASTTSFTCVNGDAIAATVTGTGINTTFRIWKNPTKNTPVSSEGWDSAGDTPDATLSLSGYGGSNFSNYGAYIGISASDDAMQLDDWYGGSLPDPTFNFTTDIDGQTRRQWDIGADEGSVEYVTSVMESGGNFSTLSAWEAANQVDLATTSTAVFSLSSASGTIPANSSVMGLTSGAVASTTVGSVSTSTQILLYNIASSTFISGERIYIKGGATTSNYAILSNAGNPAIATAKIDGTWTGADISRLTINGWTTGLNNYIRIYTTAAARHNGKWGDNKYRLDGSIGPGSGQVLLSWEDNVKIDGLQLRLTALGGGYMSVINSNANSSSSAVYILNNILSAGSNAGATAFDGMTYGQFAYIENAYIYNNIIYGGFDIGINRDGPNRIWYVYNNTVYGASTGIHAHSSSGGLSYEKNNISYDNVDNYNGSNFSNSSTNNLSGPTQTDAPGLNPQNAKTVQFVDAANGDFHLAPTDTVAKDAGADLSADANLVFATDIDGQYRGAEATTSAGGLGWDIGADEGATIMYRSVGNDTSNLNTGGAVVTIANSTSSSLATFDIGLPTNVGVGDVIQYGPPAGYSLAFITGRASSTVYSVVSATGSYPVATTSASASIFRAHTLLSNWQTQTTATVNQSIDSNLRSQVLVARDLVASNTAMFVSAYASSSPDNVRVDIASWTTGAGNYIQVYTPVVASEVGVSQRHLGKWDDTKYRTVVNGRYVGDTPIRIYADYTRITGLQIDAAYDGLSGTDYQSGIIIASTSAMISQNIIKRSILLNQRGIWFDDIPTGGKVYIWNNIIYNFLDAIQSEHNSDSVVHSGVVANNTMVNTSAHIRYNTGNGSGFYFMNNIVNSTSSNYLIANINSSYNISSDNTSPNTDFRNKPVVFVNFVSLPGYDFHLAPTDAAARDAGVSLAADPYLPFTVDIDGNARPYGAAWDIGADEDANFVPDYQFEGKVEFEGKVQFD